MYGKLLNACADIPCKAMENTDVLKKAVGEDTLIYEKKGQDTLRHTGCTRLGENNVNPKVMQYVMGHSDAQITMNVYNHIAEKSHVENEMSKMNLPETVPAVV